MESSNKTRNYQEKKNMVIKLGGGGGGIGAVLLLGGALATAALASAFVVGVKARSSTKDRRRRDQNPPPENNKQTEEDATNKGQVIISTDHQHSHVFEHPSKGAKKEVESYNGTEAFLVSTRSLILDEKDNIEINGGTPGDVDEETQIELIKEDVGNDGAEREKNGDGEIEVMSLGEGVEVSGTQTRQEENGVEGIQIDQTALHGENMELNMEKEEVEGLYSCIDGEICEEKKCVEVIGSDKGGLCKHGSNQEGINNIDSMSDIVVSESPIGEEEEKETLMAEYESSVIEHENVDGGVKESAFRTETVEIVKEDEALGESREDQVKYVNEKLVEEGTIVQMIEELIHEDTEVIKEDAANSDVIDGLEVCENKTLIECDAMKNVEKEVEEELIYHENIEATTDDIINKEADYTTEESENKNRQKDEEEEEEEDGLTKGSSNEEEEEGAYVNDEIEEEGSVETSDSSTESNSGAVWPAESLIVKMVKYEVEGKIEEDKTVEEDEDDNQRKYERSNDKLGSSNKSFINKYMVEKGMVIGILLLISWSWFFGLSWVTLCLLLFLTMLVSEIHGY